MINIEWAASFVALFLFICFSSILNNADDQSVNSQATLHTESEMYESIRKDLIRIFTESDMLPLEFASDFHEFHLNRLNHSYFTSKPIVLLMGQCSAGKTSFIRYLLKSDYPGSTMNSNAVFNESFMCVMYNKQTKVVSTTDSYSLHSTDFEQLNDLGVEFRERFQFSMLPNDLLKSLTFIDTPRSVWSSESESNENLEDSHQYELLEKLSERADRIYLVYDSNKPLVLFNSVPNKHKAKSVELFRKNSAKIRIVLNKAQLVSDYSTLIKRYGHLMWGLGKLLNTDNVVRVFIGSFWDNKPTYYDNFKRVFFKQESIELQKDLVSLPKSAILHKISHLLKRSRLLKVHIHILNELKSQINTDKNLELLIKNLDKLYEKLQIENKLIPDDFPDLKLMQKKLKRFDFSKYELISKQRVESLEKSLQIELIQVAKQLLKKDTKEESFLDGNIDLVETKINLNL